MNAQYSVLRFSPDPEEVEFVNVALGIWNGRFGLHFNDAFPKLACVGRDYNLSMLARYLRELDAEVSELAPGEAIKVVHSLSSQLRFTSLRELSSPVSPETMALLEARYLEAGRHVRKQRRPATRVERFLDGLISSALGDNQARFIRAARPADFLSKNSKSALVSNGFSIARVFNGLNHLVLLDGLNLQSTSADSIDSRALKISYAYKRMSEIRHVIAREERRELVRLTVAFGPGGEIGSFGHHAAVEMLKSYSDVFAQSESERETIVAALRDNTDSLAGEAP